jgi:hypothetical protein
MASPLCGEMVLFFLQYLRRRGILAILGYFGQFFGDGEVKKN